jgi:TRAP-type C4-dicarboxylate transport system permease small subunit
VTRRNVTIAGEVIAALAIAFAAWWSWDHAERTSAFMPAYEGAPAYSGTYYAGSWIALAAVLAVVAGILVIDGVGRVTRPPHQHA